MTTKKVRQKAPRNGAFPKDIETWTTEEVIRWTYKTYSKISLAWSGNSVVLINNVVEALGSARNVEVFFIDTGRLHDETLEYIDRMWKHYGFTLSVLFPESKDVQNLIQEQGSLYGFYDSVEKRRECCRVRKVEPLRRKLATLDVWLSGIRAYQNPSTREHVPVIQYDPVFSTPETSLVKVNPLVHWTKEEVKRYIKEHKLAVNPLRLRGFESIGCMPCTRAGEGRDGRWPWENRDTKECGLHVRHNKKNT